MLTGLRRRALRLLRRVPTPVLERAVRLGSPSYTLGTACLIEHDDKILLVQTAYRRNWSLPGGLLDRGESPAEGLVREVLEETGVRVDVCGEPIVVVDLDRQLVEFFFRATLAPGVAPDDVRGGAPEIERIGWFAREDARRLVRGASRFEQKFAVYDDARGGSLVVLCDDPRRRRKRRRRPHD